MKKINKNFTDRPPSLDSYSNYYIAALQKVINDGRWTDGASSLYSSNSVKEALNSLYNYKCAFCEQRPLGSPAQVEHFRPKNGIRGTTHTGYYWLGYEWSNLLLACGNCNSSKGTNFRLRQAINRVIHPTILPSGEIDEMNNLIICQQLLAEGSMLVNPEIDIPSKHFGYTPNGKIFHYTDKGEESIEVYNLNRDELYVNGRKKIKDDIADKFAKRLERYINGDRTVRVVLDDLNDIISEEIIVPIRDNLSFSEYFKDMLLNFEDYFIIGDPRAALLLRKAFLSVINKLVGV